MASDAIPVRTNIAEQKRQLPTDKKLHLNETKVDSEHSEFCFNVKVQHRKLGLCNEHQSTRPVNVSLIEHLEKAGKCSWHWEVKVALPVLEAEQHIWPASFALSFLLNGSSLEGMSRNCNEAEREQGSRI